MAKWDTIVINNENVDPPQLVLSGYHEYNPSGHQCSVIWLLLADALRFKIQPTKWLQDSGKGLTITKNMVYAGP